MDTAQTEQVQRDTATVRTGFWPKIKQVARHIPFAEDAIAGWYAANDPATPSWVRAILIGALAYFVMPFDAVPDFFAVIGYADDAAVLLGALKAVGNHITPGHRGRARRWLDSTDLA
ncbi:MAG: YkvA family protein [Reyranellaceae bacterium]